MSCKVKSMSRRVREIDSTISCIWCWEKLMKFKTWWGGVSFSTVIKIPAIHPENSFPLWGPWKYVKWALFLTMATPRLMPCKISRNLINPVNKQGGPRDQFPVFWLAILSRPALPLAGALTNALVPGWYLQFLSWKAGAVPVIWLMNLQVKFWGGQLLSIVRSLVETASSSPL